MKKKCIIFLVSLTILLSGCSHTLSTGRKTTPTTESEINTAQPTTTLTVNETITKPTALSIPSLNINAEVEHVGLAPDGRMDVPKEDMNVGWYTLGPTPGQAGSAVIAGHFDAKDGSPAVFNTLENIAIGATITIKNDNNDTVNFTVVDIQKYKDATFPIEKVFNPTGKPMLNLITCDGVFDETTDNYSDRLVIFAEKQD